LAAWLPQLSLRPRTPGTVAFRAVWEPDLPGSHPTDFNAHSSVRVGVTSASRLSLAVDCGTGISTRFPSTDPALHGACLRSRLTLIRLALIRNPWVCGVRDFHPNYRYSCLHFLFHALHHASPARLHRPWNAPLPLKETFSARLRRDAYARELSAPGRSTSELLRTL